MTEIFKWEDCKDNFIIFYVRVIPTDRGTKHIKDQTVDTQGYSDYEI